MAEVISFIRTDEQAMLGSTLRELLGSVTSFDRTRELSLTTDAFDGATWKALADMGIIGLTLSGEHGGADSSVLDLAVVFEELGRAVCAVPFLSSVVAATAIDRAGTDDQRAALLPGIAAGDTIATLAAYDGAHADPAATATTATETPSGWHIVGTKRYVTDAPTASLLVVSAMVDGDLGLFAIPADLAGMTVEEVPALDATRPLGDVIIDAIVPADAVLTGGDAREALAEALDLAVVAMAHEQVGGSQACLDMSVEYAKSRYQFGRAIGSFQAIKHRCADMLIALEHARSAAWHAAATFEDPVERAIAVPLAKSVCSDAFTRIAGDTIQVHGGIGFTWEHDAHLYFKRAKADALLFGTVASHRDRLGAAIGV